MPPGALVRKEQLMRRFPFILTAAAVSSGLVVAGADDKDSASTSPATTSPRPAYAGEVEANLQKILDKERVPSAVVLVESKSKGDWVGTFGTRTLDGADPVTTDDHYRIGSVTKTMTGTVVLQLVDEGKLRLDDPVSKYVPEVPNGQNITLAMVLEMRSGLHDYTGTDEFAA